MIEEICLKCGSRKHSGRIEVEGHIKIIPYVFAHLHSPTIDPAKYQLPTPYSFQDVAPKIYFTGQVTTTMSKVKSRSHYEIADLHILTNLNFLYLTLSEI